MSNDENDWGFKLDKEASPKKKTKKIVNKPLLNSSRKENKLNLDSNSKPARKSRRQMAREAGGTSIKGRDIVDPAAHWRRGLAFLVDAVITVLIIGLGQIVATMYTELSESIVELLGPSIVGTIPLDIGGLVIAFVIHFIVVAIPTASSQKSIGKKLFKLKIIGTLKAKAPLGVIIIREYIAKPISIISLIGIVIIPLNKKRKGLHDFISGTVVLDNI